MQLEQSHSTQAGREDQSQVPPQTRRQGLRSHYCTRLRFSWPDHEQIAISRLLHLLIVNECAHHTSFARLRRYDLQSSRWEQALISIPRSYQRPVLLRETSHHTARYQHPQAIVASQYRH